MKKRSHVKTLLALLPVALALPLEAQNVLPRYVVLARENGSGYVREVSRLADQGYRVVIGSNFTILRLEAAPPDTYRYMGMEPTGGPARFANWLNERGARGYRWLSGAGLLEKAPHPHNYEYRFAKHGVFGPAKSPDLQFLVDENFRPLRMIKFQLMLRGATSELFFEREVKPAVPPQAAPGHSIMVSEALRKANAIKHIDQLAQQGYRFLCPYDSIDGGIAVMMETCSDDCAGRYEYRYLDVKHAEQVESDLNALGTEGFRAVPNTLNSRLPLLERESAGRRTFAYQVLVAKKAAALQQALNSPDTEGYEPLDFVWRVGWTNQGFLVLEKETTAAAAR